MMLDSLKNQLDAGHLFWNIGAFSNEAIADVTAFIRDSINQARKGKLSESDCTGIAIRIEMSLLDSKFYSVVKSEAKEFTYICKALTVATTAHLMRLKNHIGNQPVAKD